MRWTTPTPTRLASPSLPNPCPATPSAATLSAHPKRSVASRGRIVPASSRKGGPVLASAGESSSEGNTDDDNRATAAGIPASPADSPSSPDADRRARLSRVLASTASSASSASEAYNLLSSSGLSPAEVAAAASAMLVEAALAAGNAALALDVFRAMVAPPLPVGGLLNSCSSREGGNGAGSSGGAAIASWPRPTPAVAASLAVAMARSLRPADAEAVLEAVRGRGPLLAGPQQQQGQQQGRQQLQGAAVGEVPFGFVVPSPALSLALGAAAAGAAGALAAPPSPLSDEAERRPSSGASASASSSSAASAAASASAPRRPPLAVVQPHEGVRTVACPSCRYRLELFSGTVARAASSPSAAPRNGLLASVAASAASFMLRRPAPAAAVHELDVVTPAGVSRPFRFGTATGDAPAAVGERVTVVCSPSSPSSSPGSGSPPSPLDSWRRRGVLNPSPPGTRPGEPLLVANHATGLSVDALDPPAADSNASSSASSPSLFPSWAGPLVLLAVAGDAASALADPSLPLALAAAAAGAAAAAQAGRSVVLPALRRLPESAVGVEASRSGLLAQHVALTKASDAAARGAAEDARALARLWALRAKMDSVSAAARASASASSSLSSSSSAFLDGGDGGETDAGDGSFVGDGDEYAERGGRVEAAAAALERRLSKAVELLDGRVFSFFFFGGRGALVFFRSSLSFSPLAFRSSSLSQNINAQNKKPTGTLASLPASRSRSSSSPRCRRPRRRPSRRSCRGCGSCCGRRSPRRRPGPRRRTRWRGCCGAPEGGRGREGGG